MIALDLLGNNSHNREVNGIPLSSSRFKQMTADMVNGRNQDFSDYLNQVVTSDWYAEKMKTRGQKQALLKDLWSKQWKNHKDMVFAADADLQTEKYARDVLQSMLDAEAIQPDFGTHDYYLKMRADRKLKDHKNKETLRLFKEQKKKELDDFKKMKQEEIDELQKIRKTP
jgi:hypothetical protein